MDEAGQEWGVTKKQLDFEFKEFNILDMYNDLNGCPNCRDGLACNEHKYVKKHEIFEKKVSEKKAPKKI